ncbi:MAG: methyltransferase domain-containing protein [Pseudonocardiaceae bacterium]
MTDDVTLRAGLVDELTAHGWLTSNPWRDAFGAVPRHAFLPRFFRLTPDGAAYLAIDEHHPDWLKLVYRNAVWPTQLDANPTAWQRAVEHGPITAKPTCSSTQPSLMAIMLEALNITDNDRVLEIGTGTGYNAALLAHRVGGQQVTSVDIDPDLIAQARTSLHRAGYSPIVAVADGEGGHASGGPYDRLIATCSVATIPPAWIDQVRPGGSSSPTSTGSSWARASYGSPSQTMAPPAERSWTMPADSCQSVHTSTPTSQRSSATP